MPTTQLSTALSALAEQHLNDLTGTLDGDRSLAEAFEACLRSLQETNRRLIAELERRAAVESHLRSLAHHDALTALPNRHRLIEQLSAQLDRRRQGGGIDALLFLDLDNFKQVNDRFGHEAGDQLLLQVADRLRQSTRAGDMVGLVESADAARLGGDEFVVLLRDLGAPGDASLVAERILAALSQPFDIEGHALASGVSIGIAFLDPRIRDAAEWLRSADRAMYQAKREGKGRIAGGQPESAPDETSADR